MGQSTSRIRAGWLAFCGMVHLLSASSGHARPAPQPGEALAGAGRRVLLVHGIYNSAICMHWLRKLLEARGWQVYAVSLTPCDASISFEAMAGQLDAYVNSTFPPDEKFDLVAFSMGGLVSRYYVQKLGGYRRVRRFVTLSAPNHGTVWAWLSGRAGVKEMRPDSEMLRELNSDVSKLAALDYTSIYTPLDLTIFPSGSSRMATARNVPVWVPLHPFMLVMPAPLREVERALE